jgi:hypothetical protein
LLNDFRLCCRTGKDEHVSVQRPDWSRLHETDHVLDSEQVNFFNLNIDIIVFYNQSPVKWKNIYYKMLFFVLKHFIISFFRQNFANQSLLSQSLSDLRNPSTNLFHHRLNNNNNNSLHDLVSHSRWTLWYLQENFY